MIELSQEEREAEMVNTARMLATTAHAGQERSPGVPYITHPEAVAALCKTPLQKAIAWLHDVLEDTDVTVPQLHKLLPPEVVSGVVVLTRKQEQTYAQFIYTISQSNIAVMNVKLADLAHNLSDLPPGPKRDKYELAQMMLRQALAGFTVMQVLRGEPLVQ